MHDIDINHGAAAAAEAATADVLARMAREPRAAPVKKASAPDFLAKHLFVKAALSDPDLSDRGARMLAVIVEEYRGDWGCAKRGYAYLAGCAGMTERTARRAVADCVSAGWVLKHVDRKGKDSEVNKYRPVWEKAATMRPTAATRSEGGCGHIWPQGMATDGHTVRPDVADESHLSPTYVVDVPSATKTTESPAHAREAGSQGVLGGKEDRPSRSRSPRETNITIPIGFAFEPGDVEAAVARGHTPDSVAKALASFCTYNAVSSMTRDKWRDAGRKWLAAERLPQPDRPDPNEMVKVGGLLEHRVVPRRFVKPAQAFTDSKGNRHSPANAEGVRTVTQPKPDHTQPVSASHPGAVLMTAAWRPSEATWADLRYDRCSEVEAEASLARFVRSCAGQYLADPEAAARQWLRLPSPPSI